MDTGNTRAKWFSLGVLAALAASVLSLSARAAEPDDRRRSLVLSFGMAGKGPDERTGLSELEFLPDGRRLLSRNGLDTSDFVIVPTRDSGGRLVGETYQQARDNVPVLRIELERDRHDRIVRETVRLLRAESDWESFPESRTLGWYTYQWDGSGRLAEISYQWAWVPDFGPPETSGPVHHKVRLEYDGANRNPAGATVLREIPGIDMVGTFQPSVRLHFLYDKGDQLVGGHDEGAFRINVKGPSCSRLPERLWPVVLNPYGGPWRPVSIISGGGRRPPGRMPSLPR
jgi:hypothetical protein